MMQVQVVFRQIICPSPLRRFRAEGPIHLVLAFDADRPENRLENIRHWLEENLQQLRLKYLAVTPLVVGWRGAEFQKLRCYDPEDLAGTGASWRWKDEKFGYNGKGLAVALRSDLLQSCLSEHAQPAVVR